MSGEILWFYALAVWEYGFSTPERAIAVFTAFLACSTFLLWLVTRKAAEAARKAAEHIPTVERAYLYIVIVSESISEVARCLVANDGALTGDRHVEMKPGVTFKFKNYGKTPALLKEVSRTIEHHVSLPHEIDYIRVDTVPKETFIAAGDSTEEWPCHFSAAISRRDAASIMRGQRTFWFYGRVVYDDIFGTEQTHKFVWKYSGGSHGFRPVQHPVHSKST